MIKHRVTLAFDLTVEDVEGLQRAAHTATLRLIESSGSDVAPNEFVSSNQQAADYVAQEVRMAVSTASVGALAEGVASLLPPGTQLTNVNVSNEPLAGE